MSLPHRTAHAALASLILLQLVMLGSLLAGVAPHPPATTPLFGMGPFLAASMSAAVAALIVGPEDSRVGRVLAGLAALAALVSFGPQKYWDAQVGLIWPALLSGQVAAGIVWLGLLGNRAAVHRTPRQAG